MRKSIVLILATALLAYGAVLYAGKSVDPARASLDGDLKYRVAEESPARGAVAALKSETPDSTLVAFFDFDDGAGGPDYQGWTPVDLHRQQRHWHVDDFAGLISGYYPLEGARSLWCGERQSDNEAGLMVSDGYGNGWLQHFQSRPFAVSGDVVLNMAVQYDMGLEAGYDYFVVEYTDDSGDWRDLLYRSGTAMEQVQVVIPAASHSGHVVLRMSFYSDNGWSDEDGLNPTDGAVIIDSIRLEDGTGLLDYEDFEDDALRATATADGDWAAVDAPSYGVFADLVEGATVLQESATPMNPTYLWSFFNGSTATYACGGHPEQTAVPWASSPNTMESRECLRNEARSPWVDLGRDSGGSARAILPDSLVVEYSVYRDLPLANQVFYTYRYRVGHLLSDGTIEPSPWESPNLLYFSDAKDWLEPRIRIHLDGAADFVQVGLQAADWSWYFGPMYGWPTCHSQAPLFDDVSVVGLSTIDWVGLSGPTSLAVAAGQSTPPVEGRIRIDGLTEAAGPTPGVQAYVGMGPPGTDPRQALSSWHWVVASYIGDVDGCDVFAGQLWPAAAGQYAYCFRFGYSDSGLPGFTGRAYGDLDGSANGFSSSQTGALSAMSLVDVNAGLTGFHTSAAVWGDYDLDGDRDLLVGNQTNPAMTRIFRNDGGGLFATMTPSVGQIKEYGTLAWCDFNNDEYLDILMVNHQSSLATRLYRNLQGAGFAEISVPFQGTMNNSDVSWGDYDNDGKPDLLMAGSDHSLLYRNLGGGGFGVVSAGLPALDHASAEWADWDTDGDLDMVLTGLGVGDVPRTVVCRNDGGGVFTDINAALAGVYDGDTSCGDYDNDGDPDILIAGTSAAGPITRVYRNDGANVFVDIGAGLVGVKGTVAWGDFDNDGDPDILIGGQGSAGPVTRVYRNNGGGVFADFGFVLPGLTDLSRVTWEDHDSDGDLDVALVGNLASGPVCRIYRLAGVAANTAPGAPGNLDHQLAILPDGVGATLSWSAAVDAQTPSAGLTYNLRVGTSPGGSDVCAALANATTGVRRLTGDGAIRSLSWSLVLPAGIQTFYWSVQAIDGAFAGGSFAAERQFSRAPSGVDALPVPEAFSLHANVPNPFNPHTTVGFAVPRPGRVRLSVYDLGGRLVRILLDEEKNAGNHEVRWNGTDDRGRELASGVYVCRMEAGSFRETRRMTLLK